MKIPSIATYALNTVFTRFAPQGYYYFFPKNTDKAFRIVPHCGIIRGYAAIILNLRYSTL